MCRRSCAQLLQALGPMFFCQLASADLIEYCLLLGDGCPHLADGCGGLALGSSEADGFSAVRHGDGAGGAGVVLAEQLGALSAVLDVGKNFALFCCLGFGG